VRSLVGKHFVALVESFSQPQRVGILAVFWDISRGGTKPAGIIDYRESSFHIQGSKERGAGKYRRVIG
jgi:hypothetical protein